MASSTLSGRSTTVCRGTTTTYPLNAVGLEGIKTVSMSSPTESLSGRMLCAVTSPIDQTFGSPRVHGHHAAARELPGAIGQKKIGDLLDGGINRADERHLSHKLFRHSPECSPDEITDKHANDIDQDNRQPDAEHLRLQRIVRK